MKKIDQIALLIKQSREDLAAIKLLYEGSLERGSFNPQLYPKIKSFLEHLRSSFDYMAHIIYDYLDTGKSKQRIQYPIPKDYSKVEEILKKDFPNIHIVNEKLFHFMAQKLSPVVDNKWFRELRDLTNMMKHNELPIQTRKDLLICRIIKPNGQVLNWETTKAKFTSGNIRLSGGGSMSTTAPGYEKMKDPLEIDFFGWKVADLPLSELGSEELNLMARSNKIEYYQAGNFYFDFDMDGQNVYKKLFTCYDKAWKKLNVIYLMMYPDKTKLFDLLKDS